jgi:ribonuclease VapC
VVVHVDTEHVSEARRAYRRFGKGRHAVGLNFGDVFAYALARTSGERLLFKGEDFAKTDVARVI